MIFDLNKLSPSSAYHLMTQTIIPRPIAWILTESSKENYNLAPFSYFTAISSEPPIIVISAGKKSSGELKDTRKNIEENKNFVLHIASASHAETMTKTAAELEFNHSELDLVKEKLANFEGSPIPRLKSCSIAMHCKFHSLHEFGPKKQAAIYGEVNSIYISDDAVTEKDERIVVDAKEINPLSRLGGIEYASLGEIIVSKRPS